VKVQRERERENTTENTIIRAFSLSLSLSVFFFFFSLLFVSARSFPLFSYRREEERKMKREPRRREFLPLLKPYTLNSFFFKFNLS